MHGRHVYSSNDNNVPISRDGRHHGHDFPEVALVKRVEVFHSLEDPGFPKTKLLLQLQAVATLRQPHYNLLHRIPTQVIASYYPED